MENKVANIGFDWDFNKTPQVILRLLARNGGSMDKLKLIKMIFLADREHLVRYGRPIVGGQYYTMRLGPVSSEFKDYIYGKKDGFELPFGVDGYTLVAKEPANDDCLSPSDREILDEVYSKFKDYSPVQLVDITHESKAYKANIPSENSRKSILYEDFFEDTDDKNMLELITEEQEIRDL